MIHDVVYWIGGNRIDKYYADKELKKCLNDAHRITYLTNPLLPLALEVFGLPAWGKGWESPRNLDKEFTHQEYEEIDQKLTELQNQSVIFQKQFRMNSKQTEYISFWLNIFSESFKDQLNVYHKK